MQEFRYLDKNLKLRTLTVFLTVLLGSSIAPNMTIYYVSHFNVVIAGILLIVVSVAGFIASLYGGHLADIAGRKKTMIIGSALIILGYLVAAISNSPLGTNAITTFFGFLMATIGASFADPAEQAMMIDSSTPENRRFVYSLIYWVINIGTMVGAAIGGWFFKEYLFELMLASMVVGIINGLIIWLGMSETFTVSHDAQRKKGISAIIKNYAEVFSDKAYLLLIIGMVFSTIVYLQPDYYLAAHLGESFKQTTILGIHIYGQRMLSLMIVVNTVMIILGMTTWNKITSRISVLRAYAIGVGLQGLGFTLSFLFNTFTPLIISMMIATLGEMTNVPPSQTIRADLMNPKKIGAYSGASAVARPVASIIAGMMVSASHFTGNIGMAVTLILITLTAIALTFKAVKIHNLSAENKIV